jgi:hypothetical protein
VSGVIISEVPRSSPVRGREGWWYEAVVPEASKKTESGATPVGARGREGGSDGGVSERREGEDGCKEKRLIGARSLYVHRKYRGEIFFCSFYRIIPQAKETIRPIHLDFFSHLS